MADADASIIAKYWLPRLYTDLYKIYKCVLTEGQKVLLCQNKHFYLLFSINKLNYNKAKKNEKSQEILYSKSNKKFCVYIYLYVHIDTYIYTYTSPIYIYNMHIYICTHIYTNIHTFTYIHRHIHIHITNACIHTYISIHRCTHTWLCTCACNCYAIKNCFDACVQVPMWSCKQPHAHRHACPRAHIYAHKYVYALPLSPIYMLSLVMLQLRICLQVTINPFLPGHRSTQKPDK